MRHDQSQACRRQSCFSGLRRWCFARCWHSSVLHLTSGCNDAIHLEAVETAHAVACCPLGRAAATPRQQSTTHPPAFCSPSPCRPAKAPAKAASKAPDKAPARYAAPQGPQWRRATASLGDAGCCADSTRGPWDPSFVMPSSRTKLHPPHAAAGISCGLPDTACWYRGYRRSQHQSSENTTDSAAMSPLPALLANQHPSITAAASSIRMAPPIPLHAHSARSHDDAAQAAGKQRGPDLKTLIKESQAAKKR